MRGKFLAGPTVVLGGLSLAGCAAVGPDYIKPSAIVPAQYKELKGWKAAEPAEDSAKGNWWQCFDDADLNRLEPQVEINNQTLKADEANYRAALSLIDQARAAALPTLAVASNAQRSQSGGAQPVSTASLNATANWVPDIWGAVRRTVESKTAGAELSAAELANAKLSLQSTLATAYFELRGTDQLHDLLSTTVKQYQHSLDIAQNQYKAGTNARSDVITAQAQLLSAQAQEINTGIARSQYEHAIAVLIGKAPADFSLRHGGLGTHIPTVPATVPSRLLERRPDIVAAERTMQEQNALIGVAIAAYYPDISLTGTGGVTASSLKSIGTNPAWSLAMSLSQTILNGGLTDAEVAAARANYDSSVATYRQTVLTAFQQVEDQLSAIRILKEEAKVQIEAVKAADQSVAIALNEYQAGTQNFTTVVSAETIALSTKESALTTRQQHFLAVVGLMTALGGGVTNLPVHVATK